MPCERVGAQDAALWCAQAGDAPLQVGAVCLFEAGPLRDEAGRLRLDELRGRLERQLHDLPRFRQRLAPVPLDQGLVWVDDDRFDITRHVRVAEIPPPGGDRELREVVARLVEVPLDVHHPLWELWFIDGVSGDRVAVVPKFSHVMADGMAILDFALSLLDGGSRAHAVTPAEWVPDRPPHPVPLLVGTLLERSRRQLDAVWQLTRRAADPRLLTTAATSLVRMGISSSGRAPGLSITRPVGPHRDFGWVGLPWSDLARVKRAEGVTMNDVVLAIVAGALAHYLRDAPRPGSAPRALVPVSTHGSVAGDEIENRFSVMVTDLPVDVTDPVARLRAVHAHMDRHKASTQDAIGPLLFSLADLVPLWLLRWAAPALLRRQPFVNLAVTNLPGTRQPMFLLGARMLELYPYVGVTGNIAVIIGVLSYQDSLGVGVTVDADVVTDLDLFVEGIEVATRELVAAIDQR